MEKNSILNDVKKMLGLEENGISFDLDIIVLINSAIFYLRQLGVEFKKGFHVRNKNDLWEDLVVDESNLEIIKSYIFLKVRLIFDPPQMGYLVTLYKEQVEEMEWRLVSQLEGGINYANRN